MVRLAHALLTTGNNDVSCACLDLLCAQRDSPESGAADLIDAPGWCVNRNAGTDRCAAGRSLALGCGQNLTQDDLRDITCFNISARKRRLYGHDPQLVCR